MTIPTGRNRSITKKQFEELLRHYGIDAEPLTLIVSKETFYRVVNNAFKAGRDCDVMSCILSQQPQQPRKKEQAT